MQLGACGDNVAQQRFRALDVDCEIVVDEEDGNLAALTLGPCFQQQEFVHHALVGAKPNGIPKKASHRAELAAIRTTASGLHRNDAKCAPTLADTLQRPSGYLGNQIELVEVDLVPRDRWILLK